MSIIKKIKQIVLPPKLLCEFDLKRKYSLRQENITGKIIILSKKDLTIERIDYTIKETILKPKNPGDKKRKSITEIIARKKEPGPRTLKKLKEKTITFSLKINLTEKRDKETSGYDGDMALMDRIHDQVTKTVFTYKIHAKITFKGNTKPHIISKTLKIE